MVLLGIYVQSLVGAAYQLVRYLVPVLVIVGGGAVLCPMAFLYFVNFESLSGLFFMVLRAVGYCFQVLFSASPTRYRGIYVDLRGYLRLGCFISALHPRRKICRKSCLGSAIDYSCSILFFNDLPKKHGCRFSQTTIF